MDKLNNLNINEDDYLKLDNQLCFSLYVCSKEIIKMYKPLLEPLGLTYTGYITMMALWEKDNITVKELGEKLYLDSGTLTPLLKKLETIGYLKRVRSSVDERNVKVLLTEKGKHLKKDAVKIPKELICLSNINEDNALEIYLVLKKLMTLVSQAK